MIEQLQRMDDDGTRIRVGLNGAGAMGCGIAAAVRRTPGLALSWVADLLPDRAQQAAARGGASRWGTQASDLLDSYPVDVLVEASTSIVNATQIALQAVSYGAHIVWMNAEADLAFGRLVQTEAARFGRVATSDAGDQHGVLARMIDEARLWGWDIVQAGNIKGFLDREATPQGLVEEAAKRHLDPRACCAYTDGSKLAIEMALIANGRGLKVPKGGMRGPCAKDVQDALHLFDLDAARRRPEVDYLLGAAPGGGVYVLGYMEDPEERFLLNYYKLGGGPYYLHYRPAHLCHAETPWAISEVALGHRAILQASHYANEVIAVAKRDLPVGYRLEHGIGSADVRGELVDMDAAHDGLPVWMIHDAPGGVLQRPVKSGEPLLRDTVSIRDQELLVLLERQKHLG